MRKIFAIPKRVRVSRMLGLLVLLGAVVVTIGILASIKIVQYKTYRNPQYRFTMKYPTYWSIIPRPKEGALVIFLAPKITAMDVFTPNVNVTIQSLEKFKLFNFDVFTSEAIRQIRGLFEDMLVVIESKPVFVAGRKAYRFVYTGNVEDTPNPIYYMHVWFFVENKAFIITYAARKTEYPRYLKTVRVMMDSFSTY